MRKFTIWLTCLLFFISMGMANAQSKVITGTVTGADDGLPIPGVTIMVPGTTVGTTTDFNGNYELRVDEGVTTLSFSFVGMESQEIEIGNRTVINVEMALSAAILDEVVITAMGIKREKKALGYSIGTVSDDELTKKPEADIASSLRGKVAGVNIINSSGVVGAGSSITIRGSSSITQSNAPLWIVDGVPFDAGANQIGNFSTGGGNTNMDASRMLDIDPNNIESISVLKGLSAANLYGEQGKNGVIIVTTKNGMQNANKELTINLSQSFYMNQVAQLPDYQNTWGQGGDNVINVGYVGNWGAKFSGNYMVRHHYDRGGDYATIFPDYVGLQVPYQAFPNNIKDFFQNGFGMNTYLGISKGFEDGNINFTVGYTDEEGYIPLNNLEKFNVGFGGDFKVDKFTFSTSLNFVKTNYDTPLFGAANAFNSATILSRLLYFPRNLDLTGLPWENPFNHENVFYRADIENPYWLLNNAGNSTVTHRFYGNTKVAYDLTNNINLSYQIGYDTYNDFQRYWNNKGGVSNAFIQDGFLRDLHIRNTIWNHNFMVNLLDTKLTEDISISGTAGVQVRQDKWSRTGMASTEQIVFGIFRHSNFSTNASVDPLTGAAIDAKQEENSIGVYGQAALDYKDFFYLTLALRNDWSSTLEQENHSILYPSVSASFVPTTAFAGLDNSNVINFMKFRAAFATSSGFPNPYSTRSSWFANPAIFNDGETAYASAFSGQTLGNPNLLPEFQKEWEFGVEGNFLNNKISFEGTYYVKNTRDLIVNKQLSPSTGYTGTVVNIGNVRNTGVEINLGIVPIRTNDFTWRINNIFNTMTSEVTDLEGSEIMFNGFTNLGNFAIEGEALGVIKGNFAVRDIYRDEESTGQLLINPNDGKVIDSNDLALATAIIGDPNPDWRYTMINNLSYKGFNLSFQIDYTHGGDFYSETINGLLRRGVTTDTEDREKLYIIQGLLADPDTGEVLFDANGDVIQNTIQMGMNDIFFINMVDASGNGIYDASVVRLREVSLSYDLPKKLLTKLPFKAITFVLSGQNLWYYAPNVPAGTNFDPETLSTGVGNGMGLEFMSAPSSRKFAFTVKATL